MRRRRKRWQMVSFDDGDDEASLLMEEQDASRLGRFLLFMSRRRRPSPCESDHVEVERGDGPLILGLRKGGERGGVSLCGRTNCRENRMQFGAVVVGGREFTPPCFSQ